MSLLSDGIKQVEMYHEETVQLSQDLCEQMEQIGTIVETINGLSAQTNLLARNAVIEAARAGEEFDLACREIIKRIDSIVSETEDHGRTVVHNQEQLSVQVASTNGVVESFNEVDRLVRKLQGLAVL